MTFKQLSAISAALSRQGRQWGLVTPQSAEAWPEFTGRVAVEHVQDASPKSAARLGSAADVTKARLSALERAYDMKISLSGRYTVDEFADAIDRTLQNLRQNGVEEIQQANLYFYTYADRRPIHLLDDNGRRIEHLTFDGPSERPFRKVTDNVRIIPVPQANAARPETDGTEKEPQK